MFDEHIYQRRRREILNQNGIPEPGLVQGMYWKAHPEGRKVNSSEARKKGAGWFRGIIWFPGMPWWWTLVSLIVVYLPLLSKYLRSQTGMR